MRLKGKVALVTGAGSGIGRATALRFAEEGASVVCVGRSENAGQVAEQIGEQAVGVRADVGEEDDVRRMFAEAVERFGRVDVLVNNAGIYPLADPGAGAGDDRGATGEPVVGGEDRT